VALEECRKRGIEVFLGWELIEFKSNSIGEKIGVFKNVDSGEIIEKDFQSANINPPSKPQDEIVNSDLSTDAGLIDVNPYTLQHKRFENVFAFGDAIDF
jgi:NADPH-dependent 2,4-dienoyl-CoA reductase/sulfur reductase-like enzyme